MMCFVVVVRRVRLSSAEKRFSFICFVYSIAVLRYNKKETRMANAFCVIRVYIVYIKR